MGSIHVESTSTELLSAQSHLWNHTFSFINSMSLKCAIELGIPDIIHKHNKPITLADLSSALSIPTAKIPCLGRLMRLLVHSKFFAEETVYGAHEEQVCYSLTKFSNILVTDKIGCVSPFVLLMLDPTLLLPWHALGTWFKGEGPPTAFETAHGMPIWEATARNPKFNEMLNLGMSSDASFSTKVITTDCGEVFQGMNSLVDVGGGTGTLARAIANEFPMVKCNVLDLPHVVKGLEGSERLKFVAGDMMHYVPTADATLLKWVLHDWNDEECVKILERCKDAISLNKDGGKVIIIEMVVNTKNVFYELAQTQLLFDVHMMVHTTGKQRSEREWNKIFNSAGFGGYKISHFLGLRSVIEVYP